MARLPIIDCAPMSNLLAEAEELERAGRAPGDPSRERYKISVDGRSVTLPERETTGAAIMSAAGIDSTRYDLVDVWQRVTADQPGLEIGDHGRRRVVWPGRVRLANPVEALVGVHADEHEVAVVGVNEEGLDPGDLHAAPPPVGWAQYRTL